MLPFASEGLAGLAATATVHGDLDRAARLCGAAGSHRYGEPEDRVNKRLRTSFFEPARTRHGAEAWDNAVRRGRGARLRGGNRLRPRGNTRIVERHRTHQPVSAERLAVALWGEDTPPRAVKTVQVYVARLHTALGDPDVLVTTPGGYCLRVLPGELDAERFERHVESGREALATGRSDEAAAELREALELWRGPPLAELASAPFAPPEIAR